MKLEQLPACAGGALCGTFLAYLLQTLPAIYGVPGVCIAVGLIVASVYCQIMGWLLRLVNVATMLFLTVGAIPTIQEHGNFADIAAALLLGIVFFSLPVAGLKLIAKRRMVG